MTENDACKLFVAGLADSADERQLRELFQGAGGSVVSVSLPRDRNTGRPRGFAFVTLASESEAAQVRSSLDGSLQSGRSISVRPFRAGPPRAGDGAGRPRERHDPERRGGGGRGGPGAATPEGALYIGNLPFDAPEAEVKQLLEEAGVEGVGRVHIPHDGAGRSRGFGFVNMESADAAQELAKSPPQLELRGRALQISPARSRAERGERPERGERDRAPRPEPAFSSAAGPPLGTADLPVERASWDEPRRANRKKPKEKRKRSKSTTSDRHERRRSEGFRSARGRQQISDWDED